MQGDIARWLKKEDDKISPNDVLWEVETVCEGLLGYNSIFLYICLYFVFIIMETNASLLCLRIPLSILLTLGYFSYLAD